MTSLGAIAISITLPIILVSIALFVISIYLDKELLIVVENNTVTVLPASCGSKIYVVFNNSVTGSRVEITYRYCRSFEGRYMITDSAAYEYYSMGFMDVNKSISSYRGEYIAFCSESSIYIGIDGFGRHVPPGSCIVVTSLGMVLKNMLREIPGFPWISIPT
ncbi:hypothetical protein ATG_14210 [Desulfurococcaceae archaeon AG1]|jgi:hypothetical protein|nr:hypothetical protein ATG_14210 [Desulfurococcaceae archaeon AG1]